MRKKPFAVLAVLAVMFSIACGSSPVAPEVPDQSSVKQGSATTANPLPPGFIQLSPGVVYNLKSKDPLPPGFVRLGPGVIAKMASRATPAAKGDVTAMSNGTLVIHGVTYTDDSGYYIRVYGPDGFYAKVDGVQYDFDDDGPGEDGEIERSLSAGTHTVSYDNIPEWLYPYPWCQPTVPSFNVNISTGQTTEVWITWDDESTCEQA